MRGGELPSQAELELVDHIEIDHERELAPGTDLIPLIHAEMHARRKDWGHTHRRNGEMVFNP